MEERGVPATVPVSSPPTVLVIEYPDGKLAVSSDVDVFHLPGRIFVHSRAGLEDNSMASPHRAQFLKALEGVPKHALGAVAKLLSEQPQQRYHRKWAVNQIDQLTNGKRITRQPTDKPAVVFIDYMDWVVNPDRVIIKHISMRDLSDPLRLGNGQAVAIAKSLPPVLQQDLWTRLQGWTGPTPGRQLS